MGVFKRGDIWWFEFRLRGVRYQRSTFQKNKGLARDMETSFKAALLRGEVGITEAKVIPTFRQAMTAFLEWSKQHHGENHRTYTRYQTSSIALLDYFGSKRLDQITTEAVEAFKLKRASVTSERTKRRLKPATVNRELACGRAMYNDALKADLWDPLESTCRHASLSIL